jgi:hypothetical protein
MRTFAIKPKSSQRDSRSASFVRPARASPATMASNRFALDFKRIPLHAKAETEAQPRLKIGTPGDAHEREADRAAEQVTSVPAPAPWSSEQGGDRPLSSHERARFEPRFGQDFSGIRIHADARSAEMADALNAEAFTVGHNVYFGSGRLQPQTREWDQLLAHELAHITQQSRTGPALQPKLKMTGKANNVARTITLLNSGLRGYRVSVDKSGDVTIIENFVELPPDAQQQALANRLTNIISDPKDVIMTISAGSQTLVGSYETGDIDIADIEAIGVSALIHEIEEQYQKQAKGVAFGSETTGAHGEGIKAESEVKGAKRGAQKVISSKSNADGTFDAVIEIPYTYPDGTMKTMVMTITKDNVTSVTWK